MDLGLGEEATHSNEIIEEEYHFEVNIDLFLNEKFKVKYPSRSIANFYFVNSV